MSSIKDKLKSKIKSRIEQAETMQSFDQNSVSVTISQGKTQLSEIKLQCFWNSKTNMKNPRLKCRWYNRTENNLQEIAGVEDQNYQPSILDVGSIVEVTCEPELPGISYEGMPFQLKSTPITLAIETENESSHLASTAKAKFFIQIKEAKIKGKNIAHGCQSMIKIQGYKLVLCQMKFGQMNDDVIKQITIDELFPQLHINRRLSREITMKFSQEQSCVINFKNHEVRDVFCLLNKLLIAKLNLKKEPAPQKRSEIAERTPNKVKQVQNSSISHEKIETKSSESFPQCKQQLKPEVTNQKQVIKIIQVKQSAADLLQLGNLKQEIKLMEAANLKLVKELEAEREKNYNLQNKISQINERLENSSRNYFELESQLQKSREELQNYQFNTQEKINKENGRDEELLYYRNEIKLISAEKAKLEQSVVELTNANQSLLAEVQNYRKIYNATQQQKSFTELQDEMKNLKHMNSELKLRYEYSIEQKDKMEEDLKNSRTLIEQIQAEKKYIEKKYESLTNQLSSPTLGMSKLSDNKSNGESSLSSSYVFEEAPCLDRKQSSKSSFMPEFDYREKEILDLKKQIKDIVEENTHIRGLLAKEKKPSSKTQLKLELFEVKKLVNRLSEAMVEKDMCINNLKEINKELNRKNADLASSASLVRSSI